MRKTKYDEKSQIENLNRATNILSFVKCKIERLVFDNKKREWKELEHLHGKRSLTGIVCNPIT